MVTEEINFTRFEDGREMDIQKQTVIPRINAGIKLAV